MKTRNVLLSCLLFSSTWALFAQDQNVPTIKISGFVASEAIFDGNSAETLREQDVFLYPSQVKLDPAGEHLEQRSSYNMLGINSRLKVAATGPDAFGAKTSAVIEGDFFGTTDAAINGFRLRHAYTELKWSKFSLLAGQYWHPLFSSNCYPEIAGYSAGAPYAILSRNPQVRASYAFTPTLVCYAAIVSQRDYSSSGPMGTSSVYSRNSANPELDLNIEYGKTDNLIVGATAGYKTLQVRTERTQVGMNAGVYKIDASKEELRSAHVSLYLKKVFTPLVVKMQTIYGQNLSNLTMIGGYAVSTLDAQTDERTYTNFNTLAFWGEAMTRREKVNFGLFGGYTENRGSSDDLFNASSSGFSYGRGVGATSVKSVFAVAPRISITSGKVVFLTELTFSQATYGSLQNDGSIEKLSNDATAFAMRLHAVLKYSF